MNQAEPTSRTMEPAPVSRQETQARIDRIAGGAMQHTPEQHYTVADRFEERAAQTGDNTFLIDGDTRISYAELNSQANRYADFALQQGLQPGQVAAVMLDNRPEFFYASLGLAKIGVIAALINTQSRGAVLEHALSTTGARLLLVGAECLGRLQGGTIPPTCEQVFLIRDGADCPPAKGVQDLSAALADCSEQNPDRALRCEVIGETPLFYVFTSGTTGMPKAAIISHARWLGVGEGWNKLLQVTSDDVFYCMLPLFHGAAGMSLVSNAVAASASIVLTPRFSASRFWDDVKRYGITLTQYIGETCRYLVNQPARDNDRDHSLRAMTGAGLSPDVWRRFLDRFGDIAIYEGWGSTESNCNMTNTDGKIGSCGRIPFKDRSNARLVRYDVETNSHPKDANGQLIECEPNQTGELLGMVLNLPGISSGRFEGYTDPVASAKKIIHNVFQDGDAWYSSGDLFYRDQDDYYYFVDRIGDTFRWKSENVSTMEVADALSHYADAEMINVYGVKVPGQEGRAGMAAIEMKQEISFDPQQFYAVASSKLAPYAVPLFLRVALQSDITPTFKLKKNTLQRDGYDPEAISDPLLVLDTENGTYSPYSSELLERLGIEPFKS